MKGELQTSSANDILEFVPTRFQNNTIPIGFYKGLWEMVKGKARPFKGPAFVSF